MPTLRALTNFHPLTNLRTLSNFWRRRSSPAPPASPSEESAHLKLGRAGEELAADFLERRGYQIVALNYKIPIGRNRRDAVIHAEIDIVAYDQTDTLCFIEVKTRRTDSFALPETNVDLRKRRQISRAARAYRLALGIDARQHHRYDVVSVLIPQENLSQIKTRDELPRLRLLQNFWTDAQFRKRSWSDSPDDY